MARIKTRTTVAAVGLWASRAAGLCGMGGGLLLATGDWLLGGGFGAGLQTLAIAHDVAHSAPLERLFLGGVSGPLASVLGLAGFWKLGRDMRYRPVGLAVMLGGGFGMVAFGAVHAVYAARVLVLRDCPGACAPLRHDLAAYWNVLEAMGAVPAYAAAIVLLAATLAKRSAYPRWTVLASPLLLSLLAPLLVLSPAPLAAPLAAAWPNLTLAILFAVTTAATWRGARSSATATADNSARAEGRS